MSTDALRLLGTNDRRPSSRDFAGPDAGLPLAQLEAFLADLRNEPAWRAEADMCADYYDGNQLSAEVLEKLAERGLGPLKDNLIKPTIDAVLGLEARSRADWRVTADDEKHADLAEVLSSRMAEAERETRADRACADAYAGQVKAGFAAVEVSRSSNPFDYAYRVQHVHRRELFWDHRSTKPDWSDARFIIRKRWLDEDAAAAYFPRHVDLIKFAVHGWDSFSFESDLRVGMDVALLQQSLDQERRTKIDESEWRSSERRRVAIYEVWYRTFHRGATFRLPDNRVIEYDARNPYHVAAVASGRVQARFGVFDRMRCAFFIGPHRVADYGTRKRHSPYVPFFGYREDLTGVPYGLIRQMISTQDEINARRAKLMWLLSSRRTLIDEDALADNYNTHGDVSGELARTDAYVVLNAARRNAQAVQIDDNLAVSDKQSQILSELKQTFPQTAGVFQSMLGDARGGVTANSAIQSLIDQGTMTLAEINDNYAYARRLVGERLADLIKEDMIGVPSEHQIDTGVDKKRVFVNRPARDEATGQEYLENDISAATVKVAIADVPQTPAYRQQQFTQMSEVAKSLPPQLQGFVVPFLMEASDLPKRREIAKLLRTQMGMTDQSAVDPSSPEGQQLAAQMQQQQQATALQTAALQADVALKQAQAAKLQAEAQAAAQPQAGEGGADLAALQAKHEQEKAALREQITLLRTQAASRDADLRAKVGIEHHKAALASDTAIEVAQIRADAAAKTAAKQAKAADAAPRPNPAVPA